MLTSDAGRIMDDGTIGRIDEETFYVTTTSSGAGAVEQWFSWWLADWRLDVHLSDLTQTLSAVNLAGPRAREILSRLTDADVSAEPSATWTPGRPESPGSTAWLCGSGSSVSSVTRSTSPPPTARTCGTRSLRPGRRRASDPSGSSPSAFCGSQKQHIIVGQDTDSESTPLGPGMPWAVKLDKEADFIGKWALARAVEHPSKTALVGFTLADGRCPTEGPVVLDERGAAAGQRDAALGTRASSTA